MAGKAAREGNMKQLYDTMKQAPTNPPEIEAAHTDLAMDVSPPTMEEIGLAIRQIKSGKAAGPDNIPVEVLKMKDAVNAQLRDHQAGFRKDRSCTNQIATLRIIIEQSIEWNSSLYINIDYEKAFDRVDRRTLWKLLRHYGIPEKIVNVIRNSCDGLQCKVVHGGQLTDAFQGKTKVLKFKTENSNPITLDGETLEDVKSFTYLGSIIDEQGGSDADVKTRIGKARAAFLQLKNISNSKRLSVNQYQSENLQYERQGIRTSLKADIQCSAAELVYGTTLRLPGKFFTPWSRPNFGKSGYVQRPSAFMRTLSPVSTRIQHRQVALPRELSTCSHVSIRVDSVRKPLQQPYEGPFHVIARHEKTFKVDRHGRVELVSIDRLKPAHVDDSALSDNLRFDARPIKPTSGTLKPSSGPTLDTSETSFSRPGQQHASSASSTDETTVSRPDQQTTSPLTLGEIAGSRDTNKTSVSRSGRQARLSVRSRD
ncbi:unnamed protein product [Schistosoma curassoni]|uniref:Reverse transcriptase domain-containing protein n=1 Tax=Schistosoma curassoni TaxID=6186 RepID=A0A183KA68_9TREM|nr:unnamed protein product [Schistosoma curassoni]